MKTAVYESLLSFLREQIEKTAAASKDAASYATDEESRAESQWDTQGLEASYLAAGQAHHARDLVSAYQVLKNRREDLLNPCISARLGALVTCNSEGFSDTYFIVPVAGGQTIFLDGREITTITLQSPIGTAIFGKAEGDSFNLPNNSTALIESIL